MRSKWCVVDLKKGKIKFLYCRQQLIKINWTQTTGQLFKWWCFNAYDIWLGSTTTTKKINKCFSSKTFARILINSFHLAQQVYWHDKVFRMRSFEIKKNAYILMTRESSMNGNCLPFFCCRRHFFFPHWKNAIERRKKKKQNQKYKISNEWWNIKLWLDNFWAISQIWSVWIYFELIPNKKKSVLIQKCIPF